MVLFDVAAYRPARSPIARLVRGIAGWLAAAHAERQRRIAFHSLLFAPEHRLRDLGIRREELLQAGGLAGSKHH